MPWRGFYSLLFSTCATGALQERKSEKEKSQPVEEMKKGGAASRSFFGRGKSGQKPKPATYLPSTSEMIVTGEYAATQI